MCAFIPLLFIGVLLAALFVLGRELMRPRHDPYEPRRAAFDEYRADTVRRLENEQREFQDFVDRLRAARDEAEFDQFMNERRSAAA
jgi:Protein of unknown function (DUF2852)